MHRGSFGSRVVLLLATVLMPIACSDRVGGGRAEIDAPPAVAGTIAPADVTSIYPTMQKTPQAQIDEFYAAHATADSGTPTLTAICAAWVKGSSVFDTGKYCRGFMDPATKTKPVDTTTVFRIGSVSKTFGGSLLAAKALDGTRAYDDPVLKWISPSPAIKDLQDPHWKVTLRDLARHSSGLPKNSTQANTAPTAQDVWNEFGATSITLSDVGRKWEYSNLGIAVLGTALTDGSNTWEMQIADRFLTNLAMVDTKITLDAATAARVPYVPNCGAGPAPSAAGLAGQYYSTLDDMTSFLKWNMHYQSIDAPTDQVVDEVRVSSSVLYDNGNPIDMGLTWQTRADWPKSGNREYWKGGALTCFQAFIAYLATGQGVVIVLAGPAPTEAPKPLAESILSSIAP
jgi:CubicO group peptidase (beta-lactamase class C family)